MRKLYPSCEIFLARQVDENFCWLVKFRVSLPGDFFIGLESSFSKSGLSIHVVNLRVYPNIDRLVNSRILI